MTADQVYAVLKTMIQDGGATPEQIATAVQNYLAQNPVTVSTDTTLTLEGIPADAKAVSTLMQKKSIVVTITHDEETDQYSSDMSPTDIKDAINAGVIVTAVYNSNEYKFQKLNGGVFPIFYNFDISNWTYRSIQIISDADGGVAYAEKYLAKNSGKLDFSTGLLPIQYLLADKPLCVNAAPAPNFIEAELTSDRKIKLSGYEPTDATNLAQLFTDILASIESKHDCSLALTIPSDLVLGITTGTVLCPVISYSDTSIIWVLEIVGVEMESVIVNRTYLLLKNNGTLNLYNS